MWRTRSCGVRSGGGFCEGIENGEGRTIYLRLPSVDLVSHLVNVDCTTRQSQSSLNKSEVHHATFFDSAMGIARGECSAFLEPLRLAFPFSNGLSTCPVCDRRTAATSSGVPLAT